MADHTVVVLGGGTGGLVAVRRLRRRLDPGDHDDWFDTRWGRHAFAAEAAAVLRAAGDLASQRVLDAGCGRTALHGALCAPRDLPGLSRLSPVVELTGRAAPGWGAFQVLVIDTNRQP